MRHKLCYCTLVLIAALLVSSVTPAGATPYASNVSVTGTTVNFILNEPSDILTYSLNGGAPVALNGATKGVKTFNLGAASDKFSIIAENTDTVGWTIPTGGTVPAAALGQSQPANESGQNLISDEANPLGRFNSPRGISVQSNSNGPNFGTAYIVNIAAGSLTAAVTPPLPARTLVDEGLYALRADQSDAFGFGDTAQQSVLFSTGSANSGYKNFVAPNGDIYVADFSDANGNIFRVSSDLATGEPVFTETGLNPGTYHGSTLAVYVEGSTATNNLKVYTLDEDLAPSNTLWKYDINGGPLPYGANSEPLPTSVTAPAAASTPLIHVAGVIVDVDRGGDGKWYLSQSRSAGTEAGVYVLSADGQTVLFDSIEASRTLLNDPVALDITRQTQGLAVSPDQKWLALMVNVSDVSVIPLVNGIPDLANRLTVNTLPDINSGRDIAFDAAGNIHYVSSGQGVYRILSPGGHTIATLNWDGSMYTFSSQTIAPPDGLLGDFNDDNNVDAADYVIWRNNEIANAALPNDDGLTTQAERYNLWTANFGSSNPGSGSSTLFAAVPEPGSLLLMLAGLLAISGYRKR